MLKRLSLLLVLIGLIHVCGPDNGLRKTCASPQETPANTPQALEKINDFPIKEEGDKPQGQDNDDDGGVGGIVCLAVFISFWSLFVFLRFIRPKKLQRKRTADLEKVAMELGIAFDARDETELNILSQFPDFPLFGEGREPKTVTNIFSGNTAEVHFSIFDYSYNTGRGRRRWYYRQTVIAMQSEQLQCPAFHLRPESKRDIIGSVLQFQDIDFDDHPEFSKAFVLKSDAEDDTRKFFDQELLDYFSEHPGIYFEMTTGMFLLYRKHRLLKPAHADCYRDFLEDGYLMFQALKDRLSRLS
ncbi:MAG: hypothetical protein VX435_12740 [Planctomycetota bacterium]|nr:hypothetical protein [Planctomycetota bacterium]